MERAVRRAEVQCDGVGVQKGLRPALVGGGQGRIGVECDAVRAGLEQNAVVGNRDFLEKEAVYGAHCGDQQRQRDRRSQEIELPAAAAQQDGDSDGGQQRDSYSNNAAGMAADLGGFHGGCLLAKQRVSRRVDTRCGL